MEKKMKIKIKNKIIPVGMLLLLCFFAVFILFVTKTNFYMTVEATTQYTLSYQENENAVVEGLTTTGSQYSVGETITFKVEAKKKPTATKNYVIKSVYYEKPKEYSFLPAEKVYFTINDVNGVNTITFAMPEQNVVIKIEVEEKKYSITSSTDRVMSYSTSATPGTTIDILKREKIGYNYKEVYYELNGAKTTITGESFIMPEGDVVLGADFDPITYSISQGTTANGSFTISKKTASYEDQITLDDVSPNVGYEVSKTYYKVSGDSQEYTINDSTFSMPANNITVYVEFKKIDYSITKTAVGCTFSLPTTANIGDTITITNFKAKADSTTTIKEAYYQTSIEDKTNIDKTTLSFIMPADNITVYISVEKQIITLNISENAIVKIVADYAYETNTKNYYSEPISLNAGENKIQADKLIKFYDTAEENTTVTYHITEIDTNFNVNDETSFVFYIDYDFTTFTIQANIETTHYKLYIEKDDNCKDVTITDNSASYLNNQYVPKNTNLTVNATTSEGYEISQVLLNGNAIIKTDNKYVFNTESQDNTIKVTTKLREYAISIPDSVTVMRNNEKLTSDSVVYYGDNLTITFDNPTHMITTVTLNGNNILSGDTHKVVDNIVLQHSQKQIAWQIFFTNTNDYTITVLDSSNIITNSSFIEKNKSLTVQILPTIGKQITKTLVNGIEVDITESFVMPDNDVIITAEVALINYTLSKGSVQNGNFELNKTTANYQDDIILTITASFGYQKARVYYKTENSDTQVEITNDTFSMPANNVAVYVEFEKIPYSITIPNNVTVTRDGVILTNTDKIYARDMLTITYSIPEHFKVSVEVNSTIKTSGETFTVGAENVSITYQAVQYEWQVNFASGEHYTIEVKKNNAPITSGTYLEKDVDLEIIVLPAEQYYVTSVLINNTLVSLIDNKFAMQSNDISISATVSLIEMTITDEKENAIIIGEHKVLQNSQLEIIIIEETTEDYAKIQAQIKNVKSLKVFGVKLINSLTSEELLLEKNIKVLLVLPENFNSDKMSLYRIGGELSQQEYTIQTINGKAYAMFETNVLGSFAFAEIVTKNNVWIWGFVGLIPVIFVGAFAIIIAKKTKKN